jgi:hypothetical protein
LNLYRTEKENETETVKNSTVGGKTMEATKTKAAWSGLLKRRISRNVKTLPRSCKYMGTGEVSFRMCPRGGHCERCAFAQMIEDLS